MAAHLYQSGDMIMLKDGPLRMARSGGSCEVLATLPESQGAKRYRVRFANETFDRSVSEDEIDLTLSPQSGKVLAGNVLVESKGKNHG
ncbi:cold-shock protein [Rhizobium oryziradicis]|uniref:Cold-shock protein n=1 Tax=Rhizobium oryziradicis TaxID=1867956 RepID=A0A1Q8ZLE0_9HYPH|nr:cold-shock protein [Rhizobium oryziradicis]OLP42709.1 cold-shock protein [Rhizobium oryziradicis]